MASYGYKTLTAVNGEIAVEKVREAKDDLSLVILDLTMPVMGGAEALEKMKELAPELPVVLSSRYDASQAIQHFGENTLAGFI